MKNSISKNYIYSLINQIINILVPLITIPYVSRIILPENIGIYSYTSSITTYFILFGSLGINLYAQREISYSQDDIKIRSKKFWEIFILKSITLIISIICYYLLLCRNNENSLYYRLLLIEIVSNIFDISWLYQGIEEFKYIIVKNIIIKVISTILIFLFINNNKDLNIYILIIVLSNLFGNLSLWFNAFKYIKIYNLKKLEILKNLKIIIIFFIPQIACYVYNILDKIMLGYIINDKSEVGFYEYADNIIKMCITITATLTLVIMPRIAYYYSKHDNNKINNYLIKSLKYVMFISIPMMFGIISISNRLIPIFLGNGYDKVVILLNILSIVVVFASISRIIGSGYLVPTNKMKEYNMSVIIGAIVNFILNILLIRYYSSIGACIGTVIAEFVVTIIQLISIKNIIKFKDIISISYKCLISSIIMYIINLILGYFIKYNLVSIIIEIVLSIIVYFILLIILKDNLIKEIINKIKKIITP